MLSRSIVVASYHSSTSTSTPTTQDRLTPLLPTRMSAKSFRQIVGASPSSATPVNSTLIIIDAQNEYAEGNLKVTNAASSRKAIANLLQRYREVNGKIVHVVHQTPDGAPVFTPGSKLAEEFDELKPKDGEKVIGKKHPSAFADTDLQNFLGDESGAKVVLIGYMVSSSWMGEVLYGTAGDRIADFEIAGARLRFHYCKRRSKAGLRRACRRGLRGRSRYPRLQGR
jgi:isochorismate hydrolase